MVTACDMESTASVLIGTEIYVCLPPQALIRVCISACSACDRPLTLQFAFGAPLTATTYSILSPWATLRSLSCAVGENGRAGKPVCGISSKRYASGLLCDAGRKQLSSRLFWRSCGVWRREGLCGAGRRRWKSALRLKRRVITIHGTLCPRCEGLPSPLTTLQEASALC